MNKNTYWVELKICNDELIDDSKVDSSFHISMEWNSKWTKLWNVNIYQWNEFNSFCNGMIANNSNRQVSQDCHKIKITL